MLKEGLNIIKLTKGFKDFKNSNNEEGKRIAARYINNLLDAEKGVFLKIGQVLGSKSDTLDEFKSLTQSRPSAIGLDVILPYLMEIYGKDPSELFLEFEESLYPASIGQVHKAKLKDGTPVAVKVQYPQMKEKIQSQLKILKLVPLIETIGPTKKWGMDLGSYYKLIQNTLEEELDYKREVENQRRFSELNKDVPYLKTSRIFEEYSNNKVIVQSWEEGLSIQEVAKLWSQEDRDLIGKQLIQIFFKNLFIDGFFQGDCNIGNYLFRKESSGKPVAIFIDFGNCVSFEEKRRHTLCRIILDTIDEENFDPLAAFSLIGFDKEKLAHIKKTLPILLNVIFEPFKYSFKYDLKKWNLKDKVDLILGEYKWWFRSAGDTVFFQVIKSFFGTVNLLETIDSKVSWKRVFEESIDSITDKAYDIEYPHLDDEFFSFKTIAKNLNVIVTENEREKVNLSMPASAIINLEDLIDQDLRDKLEKKGYEIEKIKKDVLNSGAPPQTVFELEEGPKHYIVRLV